MPNTYSTTFSHFTYNGTPSSNFNMYASLEDVYNVPQRNVENIHIAGRNGDLLIDGGTFANIDVEYKCVIPYDFQANNQSIRDWLCSAVGYQRLENDPNPSLRGNDFGTWYRMARVKSVEFEPMYTNQSAAIAKVVFDCKPQRYIVTNPVVLNDNPSALTNPTPYIALPQFDLTNPRANDRISWGVDSYISVVKPYPYDNAFVDCENFEATARVNGAVVDVTEYFEFHNVGIQSGAVTFQWSRAHIEVTGQGALLNPRWWTI